MPRTPSMFGTFTVTVDVNDEPSRSTDTLPLHLQRDIRKLVYPPSRQSSLSFSRVQPLLQRTCRPSLWMMVSTSLRPVRAQHSRLLSTLPSRRYSRISHRRLQVAIPSHRPIQRSPPRTRTMPGISSPTTSRGVMSTKSIVREYYPAQRATAFFCAPQRLCATSAPLKLAKNVVSARPRCVPLSLSFTRHGRFNASLYSSSAPELGLHVFVAHRVITSVNMRPRLHPNLQIPQRAVVHARSENRHKKIWPHHPLLTVVSKQRYPNSCHFIIPTTRLHTGRVPPRAMTVQWKSLGNSTGGFSQTPPTIPLWDSHPSLPPIRFDMTTLSR